MQAEARDAAERQPERRSRHPGRHDGEPGEHDGRDPEARTFQNGGKVVNLRIATSETWRDRNTGERKERTEWHSVAIFNENLGRIAEQYLRKGSTVYIEGQLREIRAQKRVEPPMPTA